MTRVSNPPQVKSHLDKGAFGSIHKGKLGKSPVAVKRVSHEIFGIKPVTQITRELCIELEVGESPRETHAISGLT